MKKIFLLFTAFLTMISCFWMCGVHSDAGTKKRGYAVIRSVKDADREMIGFDDDGNFIMVTHDKMAGSGVVNTYRTLGWTIKRYDAPIKGNQSVRIKLMASGESKTDPKDPEYAYNYFVCPKETIFQKIGQCSEEWLRELYADGGFVYLDAVMTVCESGVPKGSMNENGETDGEVYFTYEEIIGAGTWSDKESIRSHFDKILQFPKKTDMLYGTFEIHYMELVDGMEEHAVSLADLGMDQEKTKLMKEKREFKAEDIPKEDLKYVKTKLVYRRYGQQVKKAYPQNPYTLDNTKLDFKYVKVYFYYERKDDKTRRSFIRYGSDLAKNGNQAEISAENKGCPAFDVQRGIPTSEKIRIDGSVQKYALTMAYERHSGSMLVPVTVYVSYINRTYQEDEVVDTPVSYTQTCYVRKKYSYYTIERLTLLLADEVTVKNYSFPEGEIVIDGFYAPRIVYQTKKGEYTKLPHAFASINGGILEGSGIGSGEIQQAAEAACGEIEVINDTLSIDGEVIMKEGPFQAEADPPKKMEGERMVSVEKGEIQIPDTKKNGTWESEAFVRYRLYKDTKKNLYEIQNVNPVVVHTPVVCKGGSSDEIAYNQQIAPTAYHSLILGRDFRVSVSTSGKHLNYPGYGTKDYEKYTRYRQVRFPFAVYYQNQYIPENSWVNLSGESEGGVVSQTFYLPVGVEEGDYVVWFRTLAENYGSVSGGSMRMEQSANVSIENYAATDHMTVTVLGRLYVMELTDIVDRPRWTDVFYRPDGVTKTGVTYRIGNKNGNGLPLDGFDERFIFPVLRGSHPYNLLAGPVRLGYRVKYRLKTIGNMRGEQDRIILKPSYYYVDNDAKNRRQVDIYTAKHLQPVTQTIVLDASCRSYQSVSERNVSSAEKRDTSVQVWDGEYMLSPDVVFVPHGIDLKSYVQRKGGRIRQDDPLFLTGGYLIVQFQIYTVSGGKAHLDYVNAGNSGNGYCNMWKKEGFSYYRVDNRGMEWYFRDGDTFVFDRNKTMYDDYRSVGTH